MLFQCLCPLTPITLEKQKPTTTKPYGPIWTLARLKVQCQESSAAGSLGYQLTEMGRRMPWASGGTCLTITLELLRKEGGRTDTGLSSLSLEPPLSHPQHRLREHSPLYTKAHHPHSLVSLFQNIPRLLKDSRSRLKKKNLEPQS